jgi:hypothetical protein
MLHTVRFKGGRKRSTLPSLKRPILLAVAGVLGTATPLLGANSYVGPAGGDWNTSSFWSTGAVPIAGQDVLFAPSGSGSYAYDGNYASPLDSLTVGNISGSAPTLNQSGSTLETNSESLIGGTFNQTGGVLSSGTTTIGSGSTSSATQIVSNATMNADDLIVGTAGGAGTISENTGSDITLSAETLTIGNGTGSSGTGNFAGGVLNDLAPGTMETGGGDLTVGSNGGTGTLLMSGTSNIALGLGTLTVGGGTGSSGTANFSGGQFSATIVSVGAMGTLIQSGTSDMNIELSVEISGVASLSGGTMIASIGAVNIGNGSLYQSGSSDVSAGELIIAGNGVANLSGGTLSIQSGAQVGDLANGTLLQSGTSYISLERGVFIVARGGGTTSNATLNFSGGTYSAQNTELDVGNSGGNGTFLQSGTSYVDLTGGSLVLGDESASIGVASLSGGTLNIPTHGNIYVGNPGGTGMLEQGGTSYINLASGTLTVGNGTGSSGTASFGGGTLSAMGGTIIVGNGSSGTLLETGSGNVTAGTLIIGNGTAALGNTSLSGGTLVAGPTYVGVGGTGTLSQSGSLTFSSLGTLQIGSTGTLVVSGGTMDVAKFVNSGSMKITGGTLAITGSGSLGAGTTSSLGIIKPGVLDIGSSGLVIEYGVNPSPVGDLSFAHTARNYPTNSIQRYAQTAIDNLNWDGPGISSSFAENDPNGLTAVGVADENDLDNVYPTDYTIAGGGPGTWMGQPINDTDNVLVRMTYYGDGNLDGVVNRLDVTALSQGYSGLAGYVGWSDGDYNYDGQINKNDVSLLAESYIFQGAPLGDAITAGQAQYLLALDPDMPANVQVAFRSIAGIPEPAAADLLGTAGMGLLARRRRS